MQQIAREHADAESGWDAFITPLQGEIVGDNRRLLMILLGAVTTLLLLACVNAANLLLARATVRHREFSLRAAVGARRGRLVQQMLTESVLLALGGAAIGFVLAYAAVKALVTALPADFPRISDIHLDFSVFLFTLLLAIGTGIVFGIVPALSGSKIDVQASLHESGRSSTDGPRALRLRNGLVICEVTLACTLLLGASLMLRSFVKLLHTDPGFRPEQTLTASIALPEATYKDRAAILHFYDKLLDELRSVPGVELAGAGSDLPWTGRDENASFQIQGETAPLHQVFHGRYHQATDDYFSALGTPVVHGRSIEKNDTGTSRKVVVINEAMSRYWQHGDALGGRIAFGDHPQENDWLMVAGIIGDVKDTPRGTGAEPAFWWPASQAPDAGFGGFANVAIRSRLSAPVAADRLRMAVQQIDSSLAVSDLRTLGEVARSAYATSRFPVLLILLFAFLALMLAAIGTYGVIAYSVNQRSHEFGLRMALGAMPSHLVRDVLQRSLRLTLTGTALGVALGLLLSRLLDNLLYGIGSLDLVAIVATGVIGILVAALACIVPARRATRVDPMVALRAD